MLSLSANAKTEDKALFLAELTYAAIVSAPGAGRDDLNPLIMIEAPRLMFPFARAIISDMTRDGGFMPLSIQPIDFVAVYQSNLERQQEALAAAPKARPETSRLAPAPPDRICHLSRRARHAPPVRPRLPRGAG